MCGNAQCTSQFLEPPTEHFAQLQQTSSRQICYPNDVNGPTQIDVCFTLPPYVLPSYWVEHKLSEPDMKLHAEYFPTRFFWLVALLFGIDIIASAIKPSFASAQDVLISCKPLALAKIISTTNTTFSMHSHLMDQTQHIPPPPIRIVSNETIKYLSTMVYHDLKPFSHHNEVVSLFEWNEGDLQKHLQDTDKNNCVQNHQVIKGGKRKRETKEEITMDSSKESSTLRYVTPQYKKQYLAINMERDAILLKRCFSEKEFLLSQKQKKGYATKPIWIQVQNERYALGEECVMVKC